MNYRNGKAICGSVILAILALNGGSEAGVRMLAPGEDMQVPGSEGAAEATPGRVPAAAQPAAAGTVRIAVAGGDGRLLAGLTARAAPFKIVAPAANPDLVWDPVSKNVTSGSTQIAFAVDLKDLGAVIDRTAAISALARRAAAKPQKITLLGNKGLFHKGDAVKILIEDIDNRALLLIAIAGDGATQLLYPLGADAPVLRQPSYTFESTQSAPFGTDVLVAISATQRLDGLERPLKEARITRATELVALIDHALPDDARLGLVSVASAP